LNSCQRSLNSRPNFLQGFGETRMHLAPGLPWLWQGIEVVHQVGGIVLICTAKRKNGQNIVAIEREESAGASAVRLSRSLEKLAIGKLDAAEDLANPVPVKGEAGFELAVGQPRHLHTKGRIGLRAAVGKNSACFAG
jgi:hypothetical protein